MKNIIKLCLFLVFLTMTGLVSAKSYITVSPARINYVEGKNDYSFKITNIADYQIRIKIFNPENMHIIYKDFELDGGNIKKINIKIMKEFLEPVAFVDVEVYELTDEANPREKKRVIIQKPYLKNVSDAMLNQLDKFVDMIETEYREKPYLALNYIELLNNYKTKFEQRQMTESKRDLIMGVLDYLSFKLKDFMDRSAEFIVGYKYRLKQGFYTSSKCFENGDSQSNDKCIYSAEYGNKEILFTPYKYLTMKQYPLDGDLESDNTTDIVGYCKSLTIAGLKWQAPQLDQIKMIKSHAILQGNKKMIKFAVEKENDNGVQYGEYASLGIDYNEDFITTKIYDSYVSNSDFINELGKYNKDKEYFVWCVSIK